MRRTITIAVLFLPCLAVAACGSASQTTTTDPFQNPISSNPAAQSDPTTTTTTTAAPAPAPSLPYVGTQVFSGDGTKYTIDYYLGNIGYGQSAAPSFAGGCDDNGAEPSVEQSSAYVQGTVKVTYTRGSLSDNIQVLSNSPLALIPNTPDTTAVNDLTAGDVDLYYNLNDGNGWQCETDGAISLSMKPGQSVTIPMWIGWTDEASNSNPSGAFPQNVLNTWTLSDSFTSQQIQQNDQAEWVYGPKAANCAVASGDQVDPELLPFAKFPVQGCTQGATSAPSFNSSNG